MHPKIPAVLADNLLKADLSQQAVRCQRPHCVLLEFHVAVKSSIFCPVSDLYVSSWTPVEQCDMIDSSIDIKQHI